MRKLSLVALVTFTTTVFAVTGLFLALIFSIPPDPRTLSLDAFMNDQRFAKLLTKPPEQKEEEIPQWLKQKQDDEMGGKGKRHKDEEGRMGKKDSQKKQGLYALKGPKDNQDLHLAKQLAKDAAEKAGVLGIIKANQGSILASAFGRDSALGNDASDVMGSLVGTEVGEAYGVGGLGLVGSGRGGGGTGEGTIGLGNLGTIGKGGGGGGLSGYGRGAGGLGGRRASAPDVVPGTAEVRGSLDKEIIRRIIRRHINEVKFCYERELVRNAGLVGRVMVQFTIAGTGQVIASMVQSSTLNNGAVEQCIAQAVRRWEFPKPQGGGIVVVTYPFVLKASGGEE
jgi:TonB family protein